MAYFAGIYAPDSSQDLTGTVNATSSTTEIVLSAGANFVITASGNFNIRFGNSGMAASSASFFQIPSGVIANYNMGQHQDRIRLYNPGAGAITYWIQVLGVS